MTTELKKKLWVWIAAIIIVAVVLLFAVAALYIMVLPAIIAPAQ